MWYGTETIYKNDKVVKVMTFAREKIYGDEGRIEAIKGKDMSLHSTIEGRDNYIKEILERYPDAIVE